MKWLLVIWHWSLSWADSLTTGRYLVWKDSDAGCRQTVNRAIVVSVGCRPCKTTQQCSAMDQPWKKVATRLPTCGQNSVLWRYLSLLVLFVITVIRWLLVDTIFHISVKEWNYSKTHCCLKLCKKTLSVLSVLRPMSSKSAKIIWNNFLYLSFLSLCIWHCPELKALVDDWLIDCLIDDWA